MSVALPDSESDERVVARTQAWLRSAVIGLNLCPFARSVDDAAQIAYRVSAARDTQTLAHELADALRDLAASDPARIDTLLLIHPHVLNDFADYNDFLDVVDETLRTLDLDGELQVASFHPDYTFADAPPNAVEHATNRSPYPILHLLREASIERAVAHHPDPSRIYARNIAALKKLGRAGWARLAQDWAK